MKLRIVNLVATLQVLVVLVAPTLMLLAGTGRHG